ncbi:hypothetical protein BT96DRAFT_997372 [Gymnopus androsaceus JB14]|uniref:Tim44-like domain-containing protein n=1 Tax=Gymnopus androsaceus JB14 TaxID=1447944 RepID=A0A6A4HDA8_9AGAR|nr:hypothetical protein BT96DRAFT_997372 [Gymnopus androsaceus JB14]
MLSCIRRNAPLTILTRPVTTQRWASRKAYAPKSKRKPEVDPSTLPDDPEGQLKYIREAEFLSSQRGVDIWSSPMDTLDVDIPYRTAPWSKSKFSGTPERFTQLLLNFQNKGKSLSSMARLFTSNSFPGIDVFTVGFFSVFRGWRLSSTKDTAWVAPLRKILMENFISVQQALAKRDKEELSRLTQPPYYQEAERLLKKDKTNTYFWTLHRETSPSKIISVRCLDGHLGTTPPSVGNRLMINVLVRFETEQSLEIYDSRGNALHTPEPGASKKGQRIPAQKRQLTEYYVFEKRMYMNTPWQIKERIYPKPGKEPAI